ncbi:MAG: Sugar or nucleoside kinase, ribokinase family [Chloroflexi bacterium]|nr:MAG: Sugar or nucleoside kinase, ribokinase family [Chloroflexota bacterium]
MSSGDQAGAVTIVGAIGFDDIATPTACVRGVLGGSASYAALAASVLGPVHVVSVVGADAPPEWLARLAGRGIDVSGVQVAPGPSFHWSCRYHDNLEDRATVFSRPGVFRETPLQVPEAAAGASHVFLTASDASQNWAAIRQLGDRRVTMLDTIEGEIRLHREALLETIGESDIVSINASEARLLIGAGEGMPGDAVARATLALLMDRGARTLLLKHGPGGVTIADGEGLRRVGAVAEVGVVDPTGAGDSFAGANLSALAAGAGLDEAVRWGCATASFAVEAFGPEGLWALAARDVERRAAMIAPGTIACAEGGGVG